MYELTEISDVIEKGFCINCRKEIKYSITECYCSACNKEKSPNYCHVCGDQTKVSFIEPRCLFCRPMKGENIASEEHYFTVLNSCKSLSNHLIVPLWKYHFEDRIEIVEIEDLIQLNNLKGKLNTEVVLCNEKKSNQKIMSIIQAWKHHLYIDIPTIDYNLNIFADGRHRTLAAKHLGETTIPIRIK